MSTPAKSDSPLPPVPNAATSTPSKLNNALFFVSLRLVVGDGEVAQLVSVLVTGDYVQVVAQLLLPKVFLGQILEVALRERCLSRDRDARLQQEKTDVHHHKTNKKQIKLSRSAHECISRSAQAKAVTAIVGKKHCRMPKTIWQIIFISRKRKKQTAFGTVVLLTLIQLYSNKKGAVFYAFMPILHQYYFCYQPHCSSRQFCF